MREPLPELRAHCREPPFIPDRERHRTHGAVREPRVETALREPLLEVGRLRVVAYRLLEQLALDAEPDGIRRGIADASLATPLGRVECMKQLGAEVRGAKWPE